MNRFLGSGCVGFVLAGMALSAFGAPAAWRLEGNDRITVGSYAWTAGTVCFSIKNDEGKEGSVRMWKTSMGEPERRVYRGQACFPVLGFARIRAGYPEGGAVTIRIASEDIASLPFATREH